MLRTLSLGCFAPRLLSLAIICGRGRCLYCHTDCCLPQAVAVAVVDVVVAVVLALSLAASVALHVAHAASAAAQWRCWR